MGKHKPKLCRMKRLDVSQNSHFSAQMKSSVANWGSYQKNGAHMIQDCKIFRTFAPWKAKHQK